MAFTAVENNDGNGLMKEGEYEVFVKDAKITRTKTSGLECVAFEFVVRDDVEQPYQRKHIFKNFYRDDNGNWPLEKIGKYASSMGVKAGDEFELQDLWGANLIVVIKHYTGSDGTERECVFYTKPTQNPIEIGALESVELDDEDVPFF